MLPIPVTLQPSSAHRPGRPVRRLSVTPSSWAEQSVCASRIQQSWHRSAHTARPAPHYSGVVFHGMDHGPSFEAVQSRSLRGCPLLHADRTGLVHRTQLHAPSAAPRVGRPARLPCRGGFLPRSVSAVIVTVAVCVALLHSLRLVLSERCTEKKNARARGKLQVRAQVRARENCGCVPGCVPGTRAQRRAVLPRPLVRAPARPLVRSSP